MALDSLHGVLVDQMKDLLHAEKQLVRALPKMVKAAHDEELRSALEEHLEITRNQVSRLEEAFQAIGSPAKPKKCPGMEGIIAEGEEVLGEKKGSDPSAFDAALIIAAQKVEHYEIGGYGSARTLAEVLGYDDAARLLQETLQEEEEADRRLTEIAENVNAMAAEGAESAEEDQEQEEAMAASGGRSRSSSSSHSSSGRGRSSRGGSSSRR